MIPTAIHLSAALAIRDSLLPALARLARAIEAKVQAVGEQVKTGRTHLMDALPVTLGQEMHAWQTQVEEAAIRIDVSKDPAAPACARRDRSRNRRQCPSGIRGANHRTPCGPHADLA